MPGIQPQKVDPNEDRRRCVVHQRSEKQRRFASRPGKYFHHIRMAYHHIVGVRREKRGRLTWLSWIPPNQLY